MLAVALILNIALLLFGWRRYDDLNREVRERTEAEKRARWLADTDPLTGFLNRRALLNAGQALIAEATAKGRQVALFLLDLDHFKTVNDIHGHIARSEGHTSELQSLMRISYAVFCLKKKK